MNTAHQYSPEQSISERNPLVKRSDTVELALRLVNAATDKYVTEKPPTPESSANRVAIENSVAYQPAAEVSERGANHVAPSRQAPFVAAEHSDGTQVEMLQDARNKINQAYN